MATPPLPERNRVFAPRVYQTPQGVRLNVAAIQQRFDIDHKAFRRRQREGWPALGGGRFASVMTPWARGEEETFLEADIKRAIRTAAAHPRAYGTTEEPRVETGQLRQLLGISKETFRAWRRECGPLEGEPLDARATEERSRATGHWVNTYPRAVVDQILRAYQAAKAGRYVDQRGRPWLTFAQTLAVLRDVKPTICDRTLYDWSGKKGCVHLPGRRPLTSRLLKLDAKTGGAAPWLLEEDVFAIRDSLRLLVKGCYEGGPDPLLSVTAAAKRIDCTKKTLYDRVKAGKLKAEFPRNKRGAGGRKLKMTFRLSELERVEAEVRAGRTFDGVFDKTPDGRPLTIAAAADQLGTYPRVLRTWIEKGLLPSATRKLPGCNREVVTVLAEDLQRFQEARERASRVCSASVDEEKPETATAHSTATTREHAAARFGATDSPSLDDYADAVVRKIIDLIRSGDLALFVPDDPNKKKHDDPNGGKKKRHGRPRGKTDEWLKREREMLEAWDRGEYATKAEAGRAHNFHRPDATKIINAHEAAKRRKKAPT
jgi:hypothetical protein